MVPTGREGIVLEQEARGQTSQETTRSRSPLLVGAIVAAVIAVIGLGIWAIVAATQTDDLAAATELTDESLAAWVGGDPAALGSLFSDDGVYVSPPPWGMGTFEGRAEIEAHAEQTMGNITNANRVGELIELDNGVYSGVAEFVASAAPFVGDFEVTMDDGLLKRFEWIRVEVSS